MTTRELIELFPVQVEITQEMISRADNKDNNTCIGALCIKSIIPEEHHKSVWWGITIGGIGGIGLKSLHITLIGDEKEYREAFMGNSIKQPTTVNFVLRKSK